MSKGAQCHGQRQSPIDIKTNRLTKSDLGDIQFNHAYYEEPLTQQIYSDKHSIVIVSTFANEPMISGGPLSTDYKLHSIHFHWGRNDYRGSEHVINGWPYPIEMHVVHTRKDLTFEEAMHTDNGLAVIAYFIEVKNYASTPTNNPFTYLTRTITNLRTSEVRVNMVRKFPISKLAVPFGYDYITYQGSLTTNDCNEVVTWIIAPQLLKVTGGQMRVFRNLYNRHLVEERDNDRSLQDLNGRKVEIVRRPY